MNLEIKETFLKKWEQHFPGSELPIACYYADEMKDADFPDAPKPNKKGYTCIFSQLASVRRGKARAFNSENLGCFGAKMNLGFDKSDITDELTDFLINVERYKKTREHVRRLYENNPSLQAQGKYMVFKRWDTLDEGDEPQVVFFFGNPDTVSGLHALANFDTMTPHGVIAPFGSGCGSLLVFPFRELGSKEPKAVISGLDPSMRHCVKAHLLAFSAPWPKFLSMIDNMDESFLIADAWKNLKSRFKPRQ
ncbi:MAG: DUF169 domain-containing protein [Deltaproteobacteria bacterium]|nr:DUF169 domain-containing protein [Deltaproteobacteria bacterium]MBW1819591.1 DUF169 domain-containing protein [Deltaproteobacteria bacterium]